MSIGQLSLVVAAAVGLAGVMAPGWKGVVLVVCAIGFVALGVSSLIHRPRPATQQ